MNRRQHTGVSDPGAAPGCSHLGGFQQGVHPDQVHLEGSLLLHGQRKGQVAEGVEGHRDLGTDGAHQRGLEEAVEDVHDDGVVPPDVRLPGLLRHHLEDQTMSDPQQISLAPSTTASSNMKPLDLNYTEYQRQKNRQRFAFRIILFVT